MNFERPEMARKFDQVCLFKMLIAEQQQCVLLPQCTQSLRSLPIYWPGHVDAVDVGTESCA